MLAADEANHAARSLDKNTGFQLIGNPIPGRLGPLILMEKVEKDAK